MVRWIFNLDGGPKRVNHAAVAIGDKIYSFGGYSATEVAHQNDFIDVHVLNTFTYRWERLPSLDEEGKKSRRSATISGPGPEEPSTSQSQNLNRRRAHSLNIHPLAQIRFANPPLEDEPNFLQPIESPRPEPEENSADEHINPEGILEVLFSPNHNHNDVEILDGLPAYDQFEEQLSDSDNENEGSLYSLDSSVEEFMELIETDDEEEDRLDEPRLLIQLPELGEVEIPADMDMRELKKFQDNPEIPFKRYGHTVIAYKGHAYLWGGRNDSYGCAQTLHRYDPVNNRWSIIRTQGQCPPARDGHTAVVWDDTMYIFGGYEEKELRFSQETYAFHFPTNTWTKLKTNGDPPQYRDFHAACVWNGQMFVFGGRSDENGQSHTSHDFYDDKLRYLDLKTRQWHLVELKGKQSPCGRRSHTMWMHQDKIYLFGGYDSIQNVHFNDLWQFDPQTSDWTKIKPTGQAPPPRRRQCTVMVGDRLFLFGGTMPNPKKRMNALEDLGDLYVLNFSPNLASFCSQAILKHGLMNYAGEILPEILMRELIYMSTPNQLSKPIYRMGTNMLRG